MSKNVSVQATDNVTIVGTLMSLILREGQSKSSGAPYRSGAANIRVNQTYLGKTEVSEIPVNFIAMKFKKDGTINPAYENIGVLSNMKTAQNVGQSDAARVKIGGKSGNINENMFAAPNNPENVVSSWRINANFFNEVDARMDTGDCATFNMDIFIMNMEHETTKEGEETGRLKIRGGVVQYGKKLDCIDFYVEDTSAIDFIERNWEVNTTVNVQGRIRYTSEVEEYHSASSWGEDIPHSTTKQKKELIITTGSDSPFDEDDGYAPEDIKVLNQDRLNRKEQIKIDAKNKAAKPAPAAAAPSTGYGWEY